MGLGDINEWLRVRRTKKFLQRRLKLTPYHFVDWADAPKDLGVDMLVVGSDQVWHCGDWGDPRVYLLEGAPRVSAITYAASLGMTQIPATLGTNAKGAEEQAAEPIYRRGLARFKAISCREAEGAAICRQLGFAAAHVVDPTLIAWCNSEAQDVSGRRDLVCYFLSESIAEHFDALAEFARRENCRVKVLLDCPWSLPFPCSPARVKTWVKGIKARLNWRVQILDAAGPEEFLAAFKSARWVVSDSFHALMFAINNNCNARIIRPHSELRQKMFARIEEFAAHTEGPLIVDSVTAALASLSAMEAVKYDYDWIQQRIDYSKGWLKDHLN